MDAYIFEFSSKDPNVASIIGRDGPMEKAKSFELARELVRSGRTITVMLGNAGREMFEAMAGVPRMELASLKTPAILTAIRDGQVWIEANSLANFLASSVTHRFSTKLLDKSPACCAEHIGEHIFRGIFNMIVSASGLVASDFLRKAEVQLDNKPSSESPSDVPEKAAV